MNKTVADINQSPEAFIASIEHPRRKMDSLVLLKLFEDISGKPPVMWGDAIIGYGEYHYKYDSGREGDFMRLGFSPRKSSLSVYIVPGYSELTDELSRLGKFKFGRSCLYVNKLADIDMMVLEDICRKSLAIMERDYPE